MRRSVTAAVLAAVALGVGLAGPGAVPAAAPCPVESFTYQHGIVVFFEHGHTTRVRVEIADTEDKQRYGLMCRTALDPDQGMLFVYTYSTDEAFWMKNTLIPLSIAFMDDGPSHQWHIVDLLDMKVDPDPSHPDPKSTYSSSKPYRYALEVNRGFFAQHGIDTKAEVVFFPEAKRRPTWGSVRKVAPLLIPGMVSPLRRNSPAGS